MHNRHTETKRGQETAECKYASCLCLWQLGLNYFESASYRASESTKAPEVDDGYVSKGKAGERASERKRAG